MWYFEYETANAQSRNINVNESTRAFASLNTAITTITERLIAFNN